MTGAAGRAAPRIAIAAMIAAAFVFDTVTRLEIAVGALYVAPVLLAARTLPRRGVVALAATCVALIVLSWWLTHAGAPDIGLVNTAIGVVAVVATAWLGLRVIDAEAAFHEARAQLLRVARVTSIGQLTASIAHEVNQPLAAISASADAALRWLEAEPPNGAKATEGLRRIGADATRASEVLAGMRARARHEPPVREWADLNEIATEALTLAKAELGRHAVSVELSLDPAVPSLRLDRVQIEQVLVNLVLNAIESMDAVAPTARTLSLTTHVTGERHVEVAVADTGPGVREADLGRLFDAFWTTRRGGTGLGLTISRSIVEAHGGLLRAERRAEGGMRLVMDFNP